MTGARGHEAPAAADAEAADAVFVRALRRAATASSGAANRPGQLRQEVTALLGAERAVAVRARLHRAVAGAEEHLPSTLVSLAPLTEATLARQAEELAARRGWTSTAASETVRDWAEALGLVTEPSTPARPPEPTPAPAPPPAPAAVPPPSPSPSPAAQPATDWPPVRGTTLRLALQTGLPFRAAAHAYGGMPLRRFRLLVAALVVVAVVAAMVVPSAVPGRANFLVSGLAGLAALGLSTRLRRGLLVATDEGLTFVGFDRRMLAPDSERSSVPWAEVRVVDRGSGGLLSVGEVSLGRLRVQVGAEGCALLRAAEGRA